MNIKLLLSNLRTSVRNLMKYKVQNLISVLSIAIGIVTLAIAHAVLTHMTFPSICSQPYYDRTYAVSLEPIDANGEKADSTGRDKSASSFNSDILRALKRDGGPKSMERMAILYGMVFGDIMEFHLGDSTRRKASMMYTLIDPGYFNLVGIRSAITGRTIGMLRPGEAVISRKMATSVFGDADPRGAVCPHTTKMHPVPLTIVDVYEDVSNFEGLVNSNTLYFNLGEVEGEQYRQETELFYVGRVTVVLREGSMKAQLLQDLNVRLEPFGMTAVLEDVVAPKDIRLIVTVQTLVHLFSSLILIAALIGFLRMQVQLFWMRRREVSLRITHGAKRIQLFHLFFADVVLVVTLSVAVAMLMGCWVENFVYTNFAHAMNDASFSIQHLVRYSLCIGFLLLLLCALVIWVALVRICNARQGLASHMRGSRTHLFRNVMLGFQIAVGIIFVCGTLTTGIWSAKNLKSYNLPDNMENYKECLYLRVDEAQENLETLKKDIGRLPSLEKMMVHETGYYQTPDIANNPEVLEAFGGQSYISLLSTADTSLVDFYHLKVNWFRKPAYSEAYLLLSDSLYHKLHRLDVASSDVLSIYQWNWSQQEYPIAGTISGIPYEWQEMSILVCPDAADRATNFVLVPKAGKYLQLMRETEDAIQRTDPSVANRMVFNFHSFHEDVALIENIRVVGWVLGAISIIICSMSIYSTIALDTRSRRKEVAIRKVNGAKSRDIYRLFGRVYLLTVSFSLLIAIPVAALFHRLMISKNMMTSQAWEGIDSSPLIPCLGGPLIVTALIATIVIWHIRSTMRTNPSEIIAKE